MKKRMLYLLATTLLMTACTTSFGVGTGIGLGGGSSVSVGASAETPIKKKDDKKVKENKPKETAVKKTSPKKVVEEKNIIKNDKENTPSVKRVKQERQE